MAFSEFRRCYDVLCKQVGSDPSAKSNAPTQDMDSRDAAETILKACDIEPSHYRLGISQVSFRLALSAVYRQNLAISNPF